MGQPRGRTLAMLGVALLLAGAPVVAARLATRPEGEALGPTTRASCRGPAAGGDGFTVAAGRGSVVVGLTARPGAAEGSSVVVQILGPSRPLAGDRLLLRLPEAPSVTLRATSTPGCYAAHASLPAGRAAVVGVRGLGGAPIPIVLPRNPRPVPGLVARARVATRALYAVRELERIRPALDRPEVTLRLLYRGRRIFEELRGGRSSSVHPGWRNYFFWMQSGGLRLPSQVATLRRGGRTLAVVSGYLPIPAWLELLVDQTTGRVYRQRMLATGHFMTSAYTDFEAGRR